MTASFPSSVFNPRVHVNRNGVVFDASRLEVLFAEDIQSIEAEIIAIENKLKDSSTPIFSNLSLSSGVISSLASLSLNAGGTNNGVKLTASGTGENLITGRAKITVADSSAYSALYVKMGSNAPDLPGVEIFYPYGVNSPVSMGARTMLKLNANNIRTMEFGVDNYSRCLVSGSVNLGLGVSGGSRLHRDVMLLSGSGVGIDINNNSENLDTRIQGDTVPNLFYVDASADSVGINTNSPTARFDINAEIFRLRVPYTPASSADVGLRGYICTDSEYLYVCIADNTWKRVPLLDF